MVKRLDVMKQREPSNDTGHRKSRKGWYIALLIIGVSIAVNIGVHRGLDVGKLTDPKISDTISLPASETVLKVMSFGFREFLADLYLIKTQIYLFDHEYDYGARDEFVRLFRLITSLDPQYEEAYYLAHHTLSNFFGLTEVAEDNALLRKGWIYNQHACRFPMYIGINFYRYGSDPLAIAPYLKSSFEYGDTKHCPSSLIWMIDAANERKGEDPCMRKKIMCGELENAEQERLDRNFIDMVSRRCNGLIYLCDLNRYLAQYQQRYNGTCPKNFKELMKGLHVVKGEVPKEPFGGYFYIDDYCEAKSSTGLRPQ